MKKVKRVGGWHGDSAGHAAAAKKAVETRKERYGVDFDKENAKKGGRKSTRGYFGKLKDEDPEKLRELSRIASKKSKAAATTKTTKKKIKGPDTQPK